MYLGKRLLSVVLKVFGVDIEVVVVDSEGLGALGDAWYKLLHLHQSPTLAIQCEGPHRDVGGSHTI